jgi:hypothetical protein
MTRRRQPAVPRASASPFRCDPDLVPIVEELRQILRGLTPDVSERVYAGETSAGYHDPHAGAFCGLFTGRDVVRLEFPHGVTADPDRLLTKGRYVEFRANDRVPRAALIRLLHQALLAAS